MACVIPESMRVQNVWHVSYLKAYKSDGGRPPSPLPEMIDGELEFEIDCILNHRTRKRDRKQVTEYLLHWKGYGAEHDFWQDDTKNMPDMFKAYWDGKDPAEKLHVSCLRIN